MRRHTSIGASILAGSIVAAIRLAETIALTHHERWDGTGYPAGLAGEQIPRPGRIAAVCDVFDALLAKRPYKESWPLEKALAEMESLSGTHFDPALIGAFLAIVPDLAPMMDAVSEDELALAGALP